MYQKFNTIFNRFKKNDYVVWSVVLSVIFLAGFGCVMVYSASFYVADVRFGNQYHFLVKQIIGVILGFVALVVMSFIDYRKLIKFKWWAVFISIILLCLVFIPGIGVENYGAKRWIGFSSLTFQPSEIAKFVLVFFCAVHLSQNYDKAKSFKTLLPIFLVGGIFCTLVILEPNMSITICMAVILFIMLFLGGLSKKHFFLLSSAGALAIPALIIAEPYRIKRISAFLNPWASPQGEGFQLIQSLYALGSGGLFGMGLFQSRQKFLYLPFAESDFIFSIMGEEIGFVGCVAVLSAFAFLFFMLIKIARRACDRYGSLLAAGIASVIAVQTLLNIAVVSGSIPPTGVPLPFISAGSSSLIVFMGAVGLCLNIYKNRNRDKNLIFSHN
ncbi:MAG: putative lipid II flippase FtsW [Clostridia bacterium]|nr:putative lipid II flippase FtsW [Clostridia bacterium]MDD3862681.1 putative lipid II flippase FtsW [Clostridia bacterium]